ncbi:hypothetical protein GTQ99_03080 [Kineococcus sp. T13]|uniref:hypothetical protein n=1 Tax=Kineococcus vitellinus TaxID=2696565 RepID=UPI001412FF74|nr:hypothetical protein [Kineococcus vitellinus]NAZ74408.1 hypothetical protein [Kineococcus vitellinus]
MSTPGDEKDPDLEQDPDGDPGQLNPRDLRGVPTGDGAQDDGETDADPEQLNPRDER